MNKTYNINLGGVPFQIDDVAFDKLNNYLNAVKTKFSFTQDKEEIIEDIEARIAELFHEIMDESSRKIVSLKDVDQVIAIMGKPEEFEQELDEEERINYGFERNTIVRQRKLFRDPDDKVLGGVISGLTYYFGLSSPTAIRIIWALLPVLDMFMMGISTTFVILVYIVLWIAVPKAKTATQKMQMRGEPINLDNIERNFSEGVDNVKKNLSGETTIRRVGTVTGILIKGFAKLLLVFGLFFAFLIALGLIMLFVAAIFGIGTAVPFLTSTITGNSWLGWFGIIGLLLLCFTPLVFLISLFIKLLFKTNTNMPAVAFGTLGAFILGIILSSVSVKTIISDFSVSGQDTSVEQFKIEDDFMIYGILDETYNVDRRSINTDWVYEDVDLYISYTKDSIAKLSIQKSARGKDNSLAKERAQNIEYQYSIDSSSLSFAKTLLFNDDNGWRNHSVDAYLRIPENTILRFDNSISEILNNAEVNNITYSKNTLLDGKRWKMTSERLIEVDENGVEIVPSEEEYSNTNIDIEEDGEITSVKINILGKKIVDIDVDEVDGETKDVNISIGEDGIIIKNDTKKSTPE